MRLNFEQSFVQIADFKNETASSFQLQTFQVSSNSLDFVKLLKLFHGIMIN